MFETKGFDDNYKMLAMVLTFLVTNIYYLFTWASDTILKMPSTSIISHRYWYCHRCWRFSHQHQATNLKSPISLYLLIPWIERVLRVRTDSKPIHWKYFQIELPVEIELCRFSEFLKFLETFLMRAFEKLPSLPLKSSFLRNFSKTKCSI